MDYMSTTEYRGNPLKYMMLTILFLPCHLVARSGHGIIMKTGLSVGNQAGHIRSAKCSN